MARTPFTNSQIMAQKAHSLLESRVARNAFKDYPSFARKCPTLIHGSGLAQSVAFALSKKEAYFKDYVEDLAAVLHEMGHPKFDSAENFAQHLNKLPVGEYMRLSRNALLAASWLKRYAEAFSPEPVSVPNQA